MAAKHSRWILMLYNQTKHTLILCLEEEEEGWRWCNNTCCVVLFYVIKWNCTTQCVLFVFSNSFTRLLLFNPHILKNSKIVNPKDMKKRDQKHCWIRWLYDMQNITSKNFVKLLNDHGIKNDCIININFGKEK